MSNVLGLLAFAAYVASIIGDAAGVTWVVVGGRRRKEARRPGATS